MFGHFNKKEFAYLLQKALGDRSAYAYERETGVSRNHICLLLQEKRDIPPKWDTIQKLASKAANGVTYDQLMIAAGLIADPEEELKLQDMIEDDIRNGRARTFRDIAPPELAKEFEDLGFELVSLVKEKDVTLDELEELLVMLRALKTKRKK